MNRINEIGNRYGRLEVVKFAYVKNRNAYWNCKCDCGNTTIVCGSELRRSKHPTKSCGCLCREINKFHKGNKNYMYGKHLSEEIKKKISKTNKGKFVGINSPRWNHNKTDKERQDVRQYPEYYKWRNAVFERDDYTCQICGDDKGGNLQAHHLNSYTTYKKIRILLNNGITLCENCHKDFHHQYGYNNNTEKQFKEFKNG